MPPIVLDDGQINPKLARDAKAMFYVMVGSTGVGSVAFYLGADLQGLARIFLILLTFCLYTGFVHHLYQNEPSGIIERWQFHGWCFATQPLYGWGFLAFMILLGAFQLYLGRILGSDEDVKLALGLVYETQEASGEWWRFLTGPLLHNGVGHWMVNTMVGSGLLLVYGPVQGVRVIAAMLLAAPVSFLAVYECYLYFPLDSEGIVGISGAVTGAIGYFLAANLRIPDIFPRDYYVTTIFVALSTSFLVAMVVSTTSFIAHLGGFATGLLLGYLTHPVASTFYLEGDVA